MNLSHSDTEGPRANMLTNSPPRRLDQAAEEERLRKVALETIRIKRLRALGKEPSPMTDSPASPPKRQRLGARMSTSGIALFRNGTRNFG
jgi:hypothetical protein